MNEVWLQGMQVLTVDFMLAGAAIMLVIIDLILPKAQKWLIGWVALAQVLLCLAGTFVLDLNGAAMSGAYVGDPMAVLFKQIFLGIGALAILGSIARLNRETGARQSEFYSILLVSLLGMTLLAGARNLVLLLVAFEMMSIPLYLLAAWFKTGPEGGGRRRIAFGKPSEAAFKLFVIGSISSAITVYGLSLVYGTAGTTHIADLATHGVAPLGLLGLSMMLAGFGFKLGAVPFHMWVPDTYEGAPTPFVAFLSVAPKAAGLVALIQLLVGGFLSEYASWAPLLIGLVVGSLILGNVLAIPQQNSKRLLAFSGIAQMGFPMMALASITPETVQAGQGDALATIMFYLMGYAVANIGLFFVVEALAVNRQQGAGPSATQDTNAIDEFVGLYKRSPMLAAAGLAFLLSLAGIPFMVGFWTKVYVLLAVWRAGFGWLVVAAAGLSVVGLFYYLQVARAMFMKEPIETGKITVTPTLVVTIVICLLATLLGGLFPAPFIDAARHASLVFLGS